MAWIWIGAAALVVGLVSALAAWLFADFAEHDQPDHIDEDELGI